MSRGVEQKGCSPPAMAARNMEAQAPEGHNAGTENKAEAAKQRPRRQPCCGFCRNHSLEVPVINHQCDYAECTCVFCELTRRRRKVMRHQQRLWRYKKNSAGLMEGEENTSEGEVTPTCNFPHEEPQQQHMVLLDASKNTVRRKMVCDKCRNHDKIVKKRGHKGDCPYEECICNLCNFTIKRQQLMKHQQRVRRSQIASPTEQTDGTQSQTKADSPDSDLQSLEEVAPTTPPTARLEERTEEETEASKSPPVPAAPPEELPTVEWTSAAKGCTIQEYEPRPQDSHFHPVATSTCQPPALEPLPDYQVTSNIHSSLMFSRGEPNLLSPSRLECPGNMRLSVRCGCFGPLPQVSTVATTLPSRPTYGLEVGHQRLVPWTEIVPEYGARCSVETSYRVRPPAPVRPQPIFPARLPPPQMDWPFMGFRYPSASMLQSVPQPALSVCDNFRPHHPQTVLGEWHGARGPHHPTEVNGVHSPCSAGFPYFASALLHPSAKPSLSLMPTARTLSEYSSQLPEFRPRDQHQVNHLGKLTRSCNNII